MLALGQIRKNILGLFKYVRSIKNEKLYKTDDTRSNLFVISILRDVINLGLLFYNILF